MLVDASRMGGVAAACWYQTIGLSLYFEMNHPLEAMDALLYHTAI